MSATRRQLLILGSRVAAGGSLQLMLGGCGPVEPERVIDLSAILLEPHRVHAIGRVYRQKFPKKSAAAILEAKVFGGLLPDAGSAPTKSAVNRQLAQLIREDFANEQVFFFQSWMLSHTEGQLCSLSLEVPDPTNV